MSASKLVLRFALIYWLGLLALAWGHHVDGSAATTAQNFLIYACAIFIATRGWRPDAAPERARAFLLASLAGIATCDVVAQAAFIGHVMTSRDSPALWRSLPFVALTAVVAQTAFAYFVLRAQLRRLAAQAPSQ